LTLGLGIVLSTHNHYGGLDASIRIVDKSQPQLHHLLKQNYELEKKHKILGKRRGFMSRLFMVDTDKKYLERMLNDARILSRRLSDEGKPILKPLLATIPNLQLDHFEVLHDSPQLLSSLEEHSKLKSTKVHSSKVMLTLLYQHLMGSNGFGKFHMPSHVFSKGMEKWSQLFEIIVNEVAHKNVLVLVPLWQFKLSMNSVSRYFSRYPRNVADYLYKIAVYKTGVQLSAKGKKFLSKSMSGSKAKNYRRIKDTLKNIATPAPGPRVLELDQPTCSPEESSD